MARGPSERGAQLGGHRELVVDVGVAEEAALTAELMGEHVRRIYDVGVAGLHRLLAHRDTLTKANVIVAVAASTSKNTAFSTDERVDLATRVLTEHANVEVMRFEGLLANFVRQWEA